MRSFVNMLLAGSMLLASLPLLVVIAAIIRIHDGGPVFYSGTRLGRNKQPFQIYKFRTLVPNAEAVIGAQVIDTGYALVTAPGKFLRRTHLDELPQLFNIVKGDMNFFGPRPQRPAIYEKFGKAINGYDRRFSTKPGLIGYSQIFLPHIAPKRLQSLMDNRALGIERQAFWEFCLVFYTIALIAKQIARKMMLYLRQDFVPRTVLRKYNEKRSEERVEKGFATATIVPEAERDIAREKPIKICDINQEAFLIYTDKELNGKGYQLRLEKEIIRPWSGVKKRKTAICKGNVYQKRNFNTNGHKYAYVIKYEPVSPFNRYLILQYFLGDSLRSF